jgi:glycosyltransferase involved in cell wall biosynthesis
MRVLAILAIRDERPYLANCLNHLIENEIDYVIIDNDSTDGTTELLRQPSFARHLVDYQQFPFEGAFNWKGLMKARETAAQTHDADWILFLSPDEMMHPYVPQETLRAAIMRNDAAGYDVIDFNEFVFLPLDAEYQVDSGVLQPLRFYYFFEPSRPRLMRARKKHLQVSHIEHGGHVFSGAPFRLSPETFALRHYIFRDQAHAYRKYPERVFLPQELARGWHKNRVVKQIDAFTFPPVEQLHRLESPTDRDLCRENPRKTHYWQW